MTQRVNEFGQPVGPALPYWQPVPAPEADSMVGIYCRLEPLNVELHCEDLYTAYASAPDGRDWTWLTEERPESLEAFRIWLSQRAAENGFVTFTLFCARRDKPVGLVSYLRIDPSNGVLEIGGVTWSPLMKRTVIGTEALWLMINNAFTLGYRRCEWKCDSLNEPSRQAALRLGFTWEGTFRQMMARKGRSRDSDWFSIIDSEWPAINQVLTQWLSAENIDASGQQRQSLSNLMRAIKPIDGSVNWPTL
ncbi:GNAT family N-acetyltransferase [Pantoea agglomerans]|uniref:GNAT family N-acetyltransferase n=1 Tax=Enterobacter agglomerans TaxID=549 RepID=A0ACC5RR59_ENTAG|nr:GNAT family protein [Pantoea agglomerans]MBK4726962.1 GNAT family N-acetyltransferase [Pantoea agglomerans]